MNRARRTLPVFASCLFLAATAHAHGRSQAAPDERDVWTQEELEAVTATIQAEVEALRGKSFQRPVAVRLSDAAGFVRHARERMDRFAPPEELERQGELAQLLGLVPARMDLVATLLDVLEEQVGGFYDPTEETFYLMETFTGDVARIILAHELTHALDDQYFDLDASLEARIDHSDASAAYSAVVEGSGMLTMTRWTLERMGELSPADLADAQSMGVEELEKAPAYIWKPLLATYIKGNGFLNSGYGMAKKRAKAEGEEADVNDVVDRAFLTPPRSTEQILHPEKYWDPEQADEPRVIEVDTAAMGEGWEVLHREVLGELGLAMVVASDEARALPDLSNPFAIMGIRYTNDAASGWDGDEALLLGRGEGRVVLLASVWDSADDAREFREGLEAHRARIETNLAARAGEDGERGLIVREGSAPDTVELASWTGVPRSEVEALLEGLTARVVEPSGH